MARVTPDPPRTIKPPFNPPGQGGSLVQHVRCGYCGLWGSGQRCDGCGAPVDWSRGGALPPMPRPPSYVRR